MKQLKHLEVVNLSAQQKKAESLGRGNGALLFRRKKTDGPIEVYYRYFKGNSPVIISIGEYKLSRKHSTGYTLEECRVKGGDLAKLRRDVKPLDLKEYLARESETKKREHEETKRQEQIEASRGTFADLIKGYIRSLKEEHKASAEEVERALTRDVIDSHKVLVASKARDIVAEDIRTILAPVYKRGSRVMGNRLRSYLQTAFAYGLAIDLDPERDNEKIYCLEYNPVSAIKTKNDAENVCDRCLSNSEVRLLWENIDKTHKVGPVMGLLIRLLLATGGLRPQQVVRCQWSDYNRKQKTLTVLNAKGRNQPRPKKHVVPLTDKAIAIIENIHTYTGHYNWLFTSSGKAPYRIDSVNTAAERYVEAYKAEHFSPRDIRRTVKNMMIDAGLNREQRNLLQGHGQTGVDIKHYERHDQLPEKRIAIKLYDKQLDKVLTGKDTAQEPQEESLNIVELAEYRKAL